MNYIEALVWNIRSCRFDVKGEIQAANLQELNTDAKHSGGLIGSSEEAPVMGEERSGQIIHPTVLINYCKMGGINAIGKVIATG